MHQNSMIVIPHLPLAMFNFNFHTAEKMRLPEYPGSAWRGAFGHALKKTVCVVRNTPCTACLLKTSCAYSYIFETPPPANTEKMRKYTAAPHPFVFNFDDSNTSDQYSFTMTLFGHGQRFFPYIIYALQKAGEEGIGGNRQGFQLESVNQYYPDQPSQNVYQNKILGTITKAEPLAIPAMPKQIKISIQSPLRIKQQGKNNNVATFSFEGLFGNLLRRISMLTYFHTDMPLETDFFDLTQRAKEVHFLATELQWYDWTRYSSRQQTEMMLGGVIGSLWLDTQGLDDFWPYLWLGQWTHAGKATSMGMGAYTIHPL